MRLHQLKAILKAAVSGAALLLLGVGTASADSVNLSADPASAKLPDGTAVPMWSYTCGATVSGSNATCRALNANAGAGNWSPVVITVPSGTDLSISLTNNLVSAGDPIPTSIVIVGQVGGGLGAAPTKTASPTHDNQGTTWPIANSGAIFTPPAQKDRVQSFGTEVGAGQTTILTWSGLRPGTYLMESGTHPSIQATMGLVGMVVVTGGSTYPTYAADVPLLFSEIDPVQNKAVAAAVATPGFSESATHGVSTSGPIVNINVLNGGSGYTAAPTVTITGGGGSGATAHAVIDTDSASPTFGQVTEIDVDNAGSGFTSTPNVILTAPGGAGNVTATGAAALSSNAGSSCNTSTSTKAAACYPSVVNYTPLYYLINGVAFDITNSSASLFQTSAGGSTISGNVLVRMVNAGSRMHIPTIVGSSTSSKPGFALVAEDGNPVPGATRVQSEVFMAAGKTYDVMIDAPASGGSALPVFDRQLSLSANSITRNAGMLAYIGVNGNGLPNGATGAATPAAVNDIYNAVVVGQTLKVSDPSKGVIANDTNIFGVQVKTPPSLGTLALNTDGTFSYTPGGSWAGSDSFVYCGNGATSGAACATVNLADSAMKGASIKLCPSPTNCTYYSNVATAISVKAPGLLDGATDGASLALAIKDGSIAIVDAGLVVNANKDGSFTASGSPGQSYKFNFTAIDAAGNTQPAQATVVFPTGAGLNVTVLDGTTKQPIGAGYRWIIEEDRTFFSDPACTTNPPGPNCPGANNGIVPNFGTNFHTSFMPVVASGCTDDVSCGNNQTAGGQPVPGHPLSSPADVAACGGNVTTACLDPNKRYYISVLPGDAAQPFINGYAGAPDCSAAGVAAGSCGHGMGGAPIAKGQLSVTVITEPSPYPPATLSIFVFEDDYPLNGEHDAGGGVDVLSPNEPGLGGFQITIDDSAGGTGDATGTPTYDMFNMPLSNSLAGTLDPVTKLDACPLSTQITQASEGGDKTQNGIVGMIVTCPTYESDGKTLSPLAGQAIVKNLWQGRYGVTANAGADRIGRGEEWVQTNTLDGQKAHDSFMRIGEPAYFQEFGPAGYHVTIGFANPKIIQARHDARCAVAGSDCTHEVKGHVTTARMSRVPDERLYGSGTHDSYSFTQCYVSLGDPDADEFMFTKCDNDGNFDFTGVPAGNWKITTFDQWNDQVVDGITTPVGMCDAQSSISPAPVTNCKALVDMGEVAVHQWQANIYTRTFIDTDYTGVSTDKKPGLALVDTNIRFRDGSYSNFNNTDLDGFAGFNEVFPLFNWYVIETDSTRYKNTGTHVVYDSGGPADGTSPAIGTAPTPCFQSTSTKPCGDSDIAKFLANTFEPNPLPTDLHIPGSVYCSGADCSSESIATSPVGPNSPQTSSTGRIDAGWIDSYGWQGFSGQNNFLEFGKRPFGDGENGGIHGHVVYASTRPFDDPTLLLQLSWEPLVPHVRMNLYKEGVAADGVTPTLTLVDHTETTSFDDWAQGFRLDANGNPVPSPTGGFVPNMSCPGQGTDDMSGAAPDPYFWFALKNQPEYLDLYANATTPANIKAMAHNAQFKCYDGMHNWNQLQPAPYDGMYSFPSVVQRDPVTGKPAGTGSTNGVAASMAGTNCTICVANPTHSTPNNNDPAKDPNYDPFRAGTPMLPDGKYVVEVVVPDGYELVKEEDKNILIGDNFIAPVVQQFGGLGSIFILPDQASVANPGNPLNATTDLGRTILPSHEADTGSVETFWPCMGEERVVPDYISLFPGSQEVAPFAGATRRLCDRKEVVLDQQTSVLAKFYVFTETHKASHFTGVITDDFTAEFDPFSPQFGEKFGPAYLPVSFKDWAGNEITRVYSDAWGAYNGLSYSTWEVNPPNPTGYGPTMMVGCMNDAGPINGKNDPLFQNGYSQFCYELPFMPGQTGYFDTPVVPTAAFAGGYNNPDCSYPDATPAVAEVDGDGVGPWIAGLKGTVTSIAITSGGSGYVTAPSVTINNTGTGGTGATATSVIAGSVVAVNLTNNTRLTNRGYSAAPTVGFTGGGGSGAAAHANMTGSVTRVNITSNGVYSRLAPVPTVTISGGGGSGAAGTAVMQNINATTRRVIGVTITNAGSGYTGTAAVTFSQGTTVANTAHGTVIMGQSVASVTVDAGGAGYTSTPGVTFAGATTGGQAAAATATDTNSVVAILVTNAGSGYASAPAITLGAPPAGGTTATATASIETGGSITITALGDQLVDNYMYTGPGANAAPYNQQKITRHYTFGVAPSTFTSFPALPAGQSYNCNSSDSTTVCPYVTVGGKPLTAVSWSATTITGTVPSGVANCAVQQQEQFGGSSAKCGQLSITAANGNQSVDSVTVTIGGKAPKHVKPGAGLTAAGFGAIQQAIDSANPGDLLIIDPGVYSEMVLMWKPVRLQGVGAASSVLDANPHPAGKLDPWRQRVVCLFGLALNGTPISATNPYNPDTTAGAVSCPSDMKFSVDRLPLEATVGWDATLNGNLAEQLIEPTLMGAYEGAGITVLGKGVWFPNGGADAFASDAFPTGTLLLDGTTNTQHGCGPNGFARTNPFPGNFYCNPSSIDGLTIQNSSQGGGAIWAHAWNHNLQIANNRILNNQGTMSGGITIGQGEHPDAYLNGQAAVATVPGSCIADSNRFPTNLALPYCENVDVNVHHNYITQNSSLGDELFSSTPAGAGGVTFCNGSDYYKFDYNWVCGNMSTGDGAGVAHVGLSYDGEIQHNAILYNQTTNPTIVTNGGGLLIMGAPDADPPCGITTDQDCVSAPGDILPSDGTGPGLVINANLILGNSADSGAGAGMRLQHINGTDVLNFPNGGRNTAWPSISGHAGQPDFQTRTPWNAVQVTNNIIANNVAGINGGGVAMLDALAVDFVNNTVINNNSTATSGVLLQTLFAPLASTQQTPCTSNDPSRSCAQVAGLVSNLNSAVLQANIGNTRITCPANHGTAGIGVNNTANDCRRYSVPVLYNDLFSQNRAVAIGIAPPTTSSTGFTNQQSTVAFFNPFKSGAAQQLASQLKTGDCDPNASFWDLGVETDTAPGNHSSGFQLAPTYSFLTSATEAGLGNNNRVGDPTLAATYCNGARVPPEAAGHMASSVSPYPGWEAPPGTNESNALPAPPFTLAPAATVDEGNNWINLRWGPLSMNLTNPVTGSAPFINAAPKTGSQAIDETPVMAANTFNPYTAAPAVDFYGTARKTPTNPSVDAGAVEVFSAPTFSFSVNPTSLAFGAIANGQTATLTVTVTNTGNQQLTGGSFTITGSTVFTRPGIGGGSCTATLNSGATCTITVRFAPTPSGTFSGNLNVGYANATAVAVPLSGSSAAVVVTPASLSFGSVGATNPATASTAQTLTLRNASGSARTITGITFTGPFSRATAAQGGAGSCGTTLNNGATCTINVVFSPTAVQSYSGTAAITVNGGFTVANSPVALTGTGATPVQTATLTPASWSPTQTRNCPGLLCTLADPAQAFTLTNTGNVSMTGIGQGALSGTNTADFAVVSLLSSCGPTGGGQLASNITLAPGATCAVTVAFRPLTAEAAGAKTATISVTDSFGTQSVNITATAN